MDSAINEAFFEDSVPGPYRDDSTAHPSLSEFCDRFSRRTCFPLIAALKPAISVSNPHTFLDVLYHTQGNVYGMREFFA